MSYDTKEKRPKAILVGVPLNGTCDADNEESLAELGRLVTTLGMDVFATLSQKRPSHAGATVLGEGKLAELATFTGGTGKVKIASFHKKSKAAEKFNSSEIVAADDEGDEDDCGGDDESNNSSINPAIKQVDVVVFDCDISPSQLANLQSATGADVLDRTGVIVEIFSKDRKSVV